VARSTLLALALLGAAPAAAERPIYLQPLGRALADEDVALVAEALHALYGVEVKRLERVDLPQEAWYAPRRRWRAEILLEFLSSRLPPDGDRILGLTGDDISTTKGRVYDWGVMGLGGIGGSSGVISMFRCRRGARDATQARERLAKTAVHEIGHTRGLEHCPVHGCIMEDAEGKVATSDGEYDLCAACRARLAELGRPAPPAPKIPWRRPPEPRTDGQRTK
jgi:archaemetzincin